MGQIRDRGGFRISKSKRFSGTCIKDTWTTPKGVRIENERWGWLGLRGVVGEKWRQLYLNNIKKNKISKNSVNYWITERRGKKERKHKSVG